MSFLSPLFLLGLLALALPLLLHLIRRRVVRTVPFPALRFLAASPADQRKHRVRRRVVLALRCLALAALAAAFARPFFGSTPPESARATVVVIDNSFSLQAAGRWPALLRWTRQQLGADRPGDTLGLLLMNPRPTWLVTPTRDISAALAALDTLKPGWESTRAEPALRLAGDVLAATSARERRILFLGDHQTQGWTGADFSKPLPPGVAIAFPPPSPAPARQAALLSASLSRAQDNWTLSVAARRFTAPHSRTLSIYAESSAKPILTAPLAFETDDAATLRLTLPPLTPEPAWLRLALDPDDLAADDTLWLAAPGQRAERHLLLDRPPAGATADHLATAFQALGELPPVSRLTPLPSTAWPIPAVAVLRNDATFAGDSAARLDAFLAAGGSALIFVTDGPAQKKWLATHKLSARPQPRPSRVRDWSLDHPLVAPLAEQNFRALVGWEFSRAVALPADAVEPLAFWEDGATALGECPVGPGRLLLAGWSPERAHGDWPLNPAFLPFLHQATAHLFGVASTSSASAPRVGSPVPATPAPGTWRLLSGPASELFTFKSPISTFPAPGLYEFTAPDAPRRLYAVGLSPEESDLAPWADGTPWTKLVSPQTDAPPAIQARLSSATALETETQSPLWWWAFAALALFALAELTLANRTAR